MGKQLNSLSHKRKRETASPGNKTRTTFTEENESLQQADSSLVNRKFSEVGAWVLTKGLACIQLGIWKHRDGKGAYYAKSRMM
ncbi:hypothetical protein TNCT_476491 [Trichonephila clavata]|uniref:Uncharacterized protein n=1 Tax=Trichonephila clavata TaxID=2740835 RepID=A0A8X6FQ39_TRICU|nr:hypothetical protein TNCT_476491 [Trichonephila clavata]